MKLSLPIFAKKENLSYFLVLILRNNKASAVIFEEKQGTVKIVNQHSEFFSDSIENASEEELLSVLDKTISKAESVLPNNVETQKTIFGVKENWVEDNKIKKEYLGKLKKISDELGLIPVGFLITTEAIGHFLAKEEGAPVTAILAEIDRDYISVSLLRAGKIVETKNSKLEENPAQTVDTLLKHFENVEVLPSRIIIFDGEKDLSQDFISHSWSKTLPFLHLPQTSSLEPGFDAKAVLSGAATEMGFQVLTDSSKPIQKNAVREESEPEPEDEENKIVDKETIEFSEDASSEFFGFVKNKDIAKEKTHPAIEKDIENIPSNIVDEEIEEIPENLQIENSESKSLPQNAFLILLGFQKVSVSILKNLKPLFSKIKFPSSLPIGKGSKLIFISTFIIIVLSLLLGVYLFGRSAIVTLSIDGKKVSQTRDVTFSTTLPTDESKNIIAAEFVDVSEDGSTTTDTTGNKDIGTAAKGKVTVFNNSSDKVTLNAGTTITSSNNLKFTLDNNVAIASASGDVFSGTTPGKTDTNITAADIGTNFNLPSNTKFSFNGDSSIAAKNDTAFSGGTKKSITVVSKEDLVKLESDLIKKLEQKAKDDIVKKISGDKVLLPVFVSETLADKSTDKKVGDESPNVTLKATVNYKSIFYNKADINSFAGAALGANKNNLKLDEKNIKTNATNIKTKDNQVNTTLEISGFLLPNINQQNLSKQISGKGIIQMQDLLMSTIPQIANVNIKISPNIPLFPTNLPNSSKIKFVININE